MGGRRGRQAWPGRPKSNPDKGGAGRQKNEPGRLKELSGGAPACAPPESFLRTLKTELIHHGNDKIRRKGIADNFNRIEWLNRQVRASATGMQVLGRARATAPAA